MSKLAELTLAVENGKSKQVAALVQEALDAGHAPIDILNEGMVNAMANIGEKFKRNEVFVPEMLVAARAMKKGVAVLKPHLAGDSTTKRGKMIMGTVFGDLHDIGKNLVVMMIESTGYEVVDLGVDVPIDHFMEAASDPEVNLIGISTLLTTTMASMKETVAALNAHPRRGEFKVMIGGAPITQAFAEEIGADIYTADAASAADAAKAVSKV